MGPTGGGHQGDPVRAVLQHPGGSGAELHAPLGRGPGRVEGQFDAVHLLGDGAAPVADDVAAVAVHRYGQDGIIEALSVVVQVEQGVQEGVAHALFMEGLVGIGDVEALIDQTAGQGASRLGRPLVHEGLVLGFVPHVAAVTAVVVGEWSSFELVVGQHAEGGDDVLFEVFVLVVAPDEDEIGFEFVDGRAYPPKPLDQPFPVFPGRFKAFVFAVLHAHGFGPIGGILHLLGYFVVVPQGVGQRKGPFLVGADQRGVMGGADA